MSRIFRKLGGRAALGSWADPRAFVDEALANLEATDKEFTETVALRIATAAVFGLLAIATAITDSEVNR
jgi:hypothetical protein